MPTPGASSSTEAPAPAVAAPSTGVSPPRHRRPPLLAPWLALPSQGAALPLPPLPQPLPPLDMDFALGGSQEWLGFLTASLLGLPLSERAPTAALGAGATTSLSNATLAAAVAARAAQPAVVALSKDGSKGLLQPLLPPDNLPLLMLQTFALLLAIFTAGTLFGNFQAGRQLWNAQAMHQSSPEQSIKPSGNSPLAVAAANQQLITYYNSQVLKERQQVLREALAEQPSHAAVARWEEQSWPRLPTKPAKIPPPLDRDWENI